MQIAEIWEGSESMTEIAVFLRKLLRENYDLGNIVSVEFIKAGDTNNSFLATAEKNGKTDVWYIRQYCTEEQEQDIIFEHAFEEYYTANVKGEIQTMLPVKTKNGKTWLYEEFQGEYHFYAVFNTISGREPYSWEYNELTDAAMDSCAAIVAKFHSWGYGFKAPEGSGRREPSLEEQFVLWRKQIPEAVKMKREKEHLYGRFNGYFEKEVPFLMEVVDFCESKLREYKDDLPMCINHKDLNPGNVMFDENDEINAIFDFDWANNDYRLYDIGWMGYQAIASWDVHSWGQVPLDKMERFINIYNEEITKRNCPLGPLSKRETEFLPVMMIIGAMKVIIDFVYYEDHDDDGDRLFINTWRFVESVRFLKDHVENN